jgi:hypothetical protein
MTSSTSICRLASTIHAQAFSTREKARDVGDPRNFARIYDLLKGRLEKDFKV